MSPPGHTSNLKFNTVVAALPDTRVSARIGWPGVNTL